MANEGDLEITFTLIKKAEKVFLEACAEIVPITLKPLPNNFWSSALFILEHEFFIGLNEYLKKSKSSMENMASIVEFNNANKKETMDFYGQEYFLSSIGKLIIAPAIILKTVGEMVLCLLFQVIHI